MCKTTEFIRERRRRGQPAAAAAPPLFRFLRERNEQRQSEREKEEREKKEREKEEREREEEEKKKNHVFNLLLLLFSSFPFLPPPSSLQSSHFTTSTGHLQWWQQ
jgi:membrane protein YqaA with SNARE-associated domain